MSAIIRSLTPTLSRSGSRKPSSSDVAGEAQKNGRDLSLQQQPLRKRVPSSAAGSRSSRQVTPVSTPRNRPVQPPRRRWWVARALELGPFLVVLWWVWAAIQVFTRGYGAAEELAARFGEAFTATEVAVRESAQVAVLWGQAVSRWGYVFAPFVMDLWTGIVNYVWPFILNHVWPVIKIYVLPYLGPLAKSAWRVTWPVIAALPPEVRVGVLWVPTCLVVSRRYGSVRQLAWLPLAWAGWYLIDWLVVPMVGQSRATMVYVFTGVIPLLRALNLIYNRDTEGKTAQALLSWAVLFPVGRLCGLGVASLISRHDSIAAMLAGSSSVAVVYLLVAAPDGMVLLFRAFTWLGWQICGRQSLAVFQKAWDFGKALADKHASVHKLMGYGMKLQALMTGGSKTVDMMYKVAAGLCVTLVAVYYAFAVVSKVFGLLVWPWFMFEVGRVVQRDLVTENRSTMCFAFTFLLFEMAIGPRLPFPFSMAVGVLHFPIVFALKMVSEVAMDLLLPVPLEAAAVAQEDDGEEFDEFYEADEADVAGDKAVAAPSDARSRGWGLLSSGAKD